MTFFKSALLCVILVVAGPAFSQTDINLGAINADPSAPLEITSDSLSVDQDNGTAIFQGNVLIGQGDLRLNAGRVQVVYNDASGDISRLSASGGVTFVTATEAAESSNAEYNLDAGTLVLSGDVLLTQGNSAISANSMRINLSDGSAQMEGRVRTIFNQGGN
ncbi:lipopolysaccharide export system protein LptA [Octadecabacter temperatus]|uniref:Lipopolysaccharide export system protein LptA n=1 Tax=Octadecabacter temperatus TaxID=1458307 RepID=A0A0K0Y9M3_9RHOB|nr:LptA/OstA family protein [Octadecabacter temperatus]AKS47653.1 Lipopolysaccharide export system protein LptA precursor [Octadecabacter temperatus]SIO40202.1 lipopolysaccharide export system protein LptA [Octadecabacter temperatus]